MKQTVGKFDAATGAFRPKAMVERKGVSAEETRNEREEGRKTITRFAFLGISQSLSRRTSEETSL